MYLYAAHFAARCMVRPGLLVPRESQIHARVSETPFLMTRLVTCRLSRLFPLACLMAAVVMPASAQTRPGSGSPMAPSGRSPQDARASLGSISGLSDLASDELVAELRVEGNRTIPASRITAQMSTRVGRPFDQEALSRDVRKLAEMPWFVSVRPFTDHTETGLVVIVRVAERSTVRYVEYLGNADLKDKRLTKETGLKTGAPVDPYLVEDGRRKILQAYQDSGYASAQVSILEGNRVEDRGVIYVINEGVKQKISAVKFEGNDSDFASDRRLKTRVESKPGFLRLFGGKLNRETLEADIRKLTEYYRAFGFFQARIGRTLEFSDSGDRVTVRFIIHEGPRYEVRTVRFVGNQKFADDSLALGVKMPAGELFEQAKMNADVAWLKEVYGSQGFVFADVKAEPVFLEEPGKIDLAYHIKEGKRWRVGQIFVHIDGENPHTRIQTALNRLSIRPGEIMDIRELKASERRLQASQLFLTEPARGVMPKITYRIPELDNTDFTASEGDSTFRGQSPEPGGWLYERLQTAGRNIYRAFGGGEEQAAPDSTPIDLHLHVNSGPGSHAPRKDPTENQNLAPAWQGAGPQATPARHVVQKPPITERSAWRTGATQTHDAFADLDLPAPRTIRGQSPAAPTQSQQPAYSPYGAPAPAATTAPTQTQQSIYSQPQYGGVLPGATSPSTAPVQPTQYQQPTLAPPSAPTTAPPPSGYQPQPVYSSQPMTGHTVSPSDMSGAPITPITPITPMAQPPIIPSNPMLFPEQGFADPNVDIHVKLAEAQTGRFMVGVGVNSDAGVVGQILIDESNFDWRRWPTSWRDWGNGAFRGGGQRFRIEAAPGTQVQRYLMSWSNPYVLDTPISLSLSGSYFDRRYDDWDEQRMGGRISLGYQWTENDLSARLTYRGENVNIHDANTIAVPELEEVVGDNTLHGFGVVMANDTRNNPFMATQGHYVELQVEQVVGSFDYPRATIDARKYFLLNERPDHSGRHVLVAQTRLGFTGSNTPVYDRFFAGGYSTMRGFDFRGAAPRAGGDFMFLNTLEYLFPLTADDMINGVVFCDFGTVEDKVEIDTWRVAPGVGLRIQVPAMGPAPIALDFAWPVSSADTDEQQVFTFNVGWMR